MTTICRAHALGSLLRPAYLTEAKASLESGTLSSVEFKRVEDRAVDQVIAAQEGAGLEVITDGELRRSFFFDHLITGVDGVTASDGGLPITWHGDKPEDDLTFRPQYAVTEKIRRRRMLTVEEFTYARSRARRPVKVTLPSPMLFLYLWSPTASRDAYSSPWELCEQGVALVREEIQELARLGCEYIQIDAPELGDFVNDELRARWESLDVPVDRVLSEGIDMINAAADVPGIHRSLHVCRGNHASRWYSQGGYEAIAGALFKRTSNFEALMLEYDDERSGTFEPLGEVPEGKTVVLGLVSTKRDEVEALDEIVGRIREAGRHLDIDQLAVSTQCGFASVASGNLISEATQLGKLQLVANAAAAVWGDGA